MWHFFSRILVQNIIHSFTVIGAIPFPSPLHSSPPHPPPPTCHSNSFDPLWPSLDESTSLKHHESSFQYTKPLKTHWPHHPTCVLNSPPICFTCSLPRNEAYLSTCDQLAFYIKFTNIRPKNLMHPYVIVSPVAPLDEADLFSCQSIKIL